MINKPIKRSKNLVPLSRDHHEGLLIVWKIKQGHRLNITEQQIADFVLYAFAKHLEPHFEQEEELLFSKLSSDDCILKAIEQHAAIRKMVADLRFSAEPSTAQLEAFGSLLEEHIRFEERVVFPHVEKQLTTETMDAIGTVLQLTHCEQQPLYWKDEFWVRK